MTSESVFVNIWTTLQTHSTYNAVQVLALKVLHGDLSRDQLLSQI
jgi:hypothetical protein